MSHTGNGKSGSLLDFTRTESEMVSNAPIVLFEIDGQSHGVHLRPAGEVDEWFERMDAIDRAASDTDFHAKRIAALTVSLEDATRKACELEIQDLEGPDRKGEIESAHLAINTLQDRIASASATHRKKRREYMDAVRDAVFSYAPHELDIEALRPVVTDAQIIIAYQRLRNLSDPLAQALNISELRAERVAARKRQ